MTVTQQWQKKTLLSCIILTSSLLSFYFWTHIIYNQSCYYCSCSCLLHIKHFCANDVKSFEELLYYTENWDCIAINRDAVVKVIGTYQYEDNQPGDEDAFDREPYILRFSCPSTGRNWAKGVLKDSVLFVVWMFQTIIYVFVCKWWKIWFWCLSTQSLRPQRKRWTSCMMSSSLWETNGSLM